MSNWKWKRVNDILIGVNEEHNEVTCCGRVFAGHKDREKVAAHIEYIVSEVTRIARENMQAEFRALIGAKWERDE